MSENKRSVLLVIRDGWGENHDSSLDPYNAVKQARTPVSHKLSKNWPHMEIMACGLDVGLPEGVMGNSEVGHQNIGAGRIVDQEIVRINKALAGGDLLQNEVLKKVFSCKGSVHLMGLLSDAGVHSMNTHLYGLLELAKKFGVSEVFIHIFTDGRDTAPTNGLKYVRELEAKCKELGLGKIASVCGRFWAMDRDQRWDRVEKAYSCIIGRAGKFFTSAEAAIQAYYDHPLDDSRKGDEFVVPSIITDEAGKAIGPIGDKDSLVFFNFRGDRPREISAAFIEEDFSHFERGPRKAIFFATMTEYKKGLCDNVIFMKPPKMKEILGEVVSERGIKQFRCAETEKYPHVTFFFNDYREEPFEGEDRFMAPSPRDVSTYDQKPEMSAAAVCAATKEAILSGKYGLLVVNFANADMVGHTGSMKACVKAVEVVDECLGELLEAVDAVGAAALITADHGNSDQVWDPIANVPHTQHTLNPVEIVIYGKGLKDLKFKESGRLGDIAPTLLALMGLEQPKEMTGQNLIQE